MIALSGWRLVLAGLFLMAMVLGFASSVSGLALSLGLAAVLLVVYWPARWIFGDDSLAWVDVPYLTCLGMALLAIVCRLLLAFTIPMVWAAIPLLALGFLAWRWRPGLFWFPRGDGDLRWWPAGLVAFGATSFSWLACLRMGGGPFPACFYNVDTAFYLAQIQSLVRYSQYPPPDLCLYPTQLGYHYGVQLDCAWISRIAGLSAHQATFLLFVPLLLVGKFCAAFRLLRKAAPAWQAALGIAILFLWVPLPADFNWAVSELLLRHRVEPALRVLFSPEALGHGFPMLSTLFAEFLMLVILADLDKLDQRRALARLVLAVGSLVLFKSPLFLGVGIGVAWYAAYRLAAERKLDGAIWGVAALTLAVFLLALPVRVPTAADLSITPGVYLKDAVRWLIRLAPHAFFLGWAFFRLEAGRRRSLIGASGFLAAPWLLCTSLIVHYHVDPGQPARASAMDTFQVLGLAPLVVAVGFVWCLNWLWQDLKGPGRLLLGLFLSACLAPSAINAISCCIRPLLDPTAGHEYVDNRPMGEVLRAALPVESVLLVSNDLRYPANGGVRDLLQLQMPSLWGHPCFGAGFHYGQARSPEALTRLEQERALQAEHWSTDIELLAKRLGWTHLLIHKGSPGPREIPLVKIIENDQYALYRFATGPVPAGENVPTVPER